MTQRLLALVVTVACLTGLAIQGVSAASHDDLVKLRETGDCPGCDLSGYVFHQNESLQDLSGADLSGADLTNANLGSVDLTDADLRNADLDGAHLSGTMEGADLRGACGPGGMVCGEDSIGKCKTDMPPEHC